MEFNSAIMSAAHLSPAIFYGKRK